MRNTPPRKSLPLRRLGPYRRIIVGLLFAAVVLPFIALTSSDSDTQFVKRVVHRVALSNDRILSARNGEVTFSYRNRKDQNRRKTMTLDADEFIRRFLLHVIPKGFMRVRHFGFLANRSKSLLSKCRQLLDLNPALPKLPQRSAHELML